MVKAKGENMYKETDDQKKGAKNEEKDFNINYYGNVYNNECRC